MNKFIVGATTALAFLLPVAASAATSITFINFPNSGPNATIAAGDSVDTKVTFDLTGSSELESMSLQIVDNAGNNIGMPETCFDVSDRVVSGTFTRIGNFDTTGGTEGTFGIRVRGYGVTGPGTDNNCGGTVNDNQFFSNRLTLTEEQNTGGNANNTGGTFGGNSGGTGNTSAIDDLSKIVANLAKSVACYSTGGTWDGSVCQPKVVVTPPVQPPVQTGNQVKCDMARPFLGAQPYAYSNVGIQLQSALLLDDPMSIPLLAAGSTVRQGYFGPQTHAALTNYSSKYGCNFIFN